jgi:hypothetical protein
MHFGAPFLGLVSLLRRGELFLPGALAMIQS